MTPSELITTGKSKKRGIANAEESEKVENGDAVATSMDKNPTLSIFVDEHLLFNSKITTRSWKSVIGEVLEPGKPHLLRVMVMDEESVAEVNVTVIGSSANDNIGAVLDSLGTNGRRESSFLLAGDMSRGILHFMLPLVDAKRTELFGWNFEWTRDHCEELLFAEISRCHAVTVDSVVSIVYVDHSLLFLEGIESAEMSPTVLLAEVLKVTRRSLWVFLPVGSALTAIVEGAVGPHGERFQLARFRSRGSGSRGGGRVEGGTGEEGRETEGVEVWEGVSAWVLQVASVRDEPTVAESLEKKRDSKRSMPLEDNKLQNLERRTKAGSLESDLPAGSLARRLGRLADPIQLIDISADAHLDFIETETGFETRKLLENYDAGRSFILLENTCLSEQNVVVLFPGNSSGGSRIVDEEYLAADEDRGFLYTNLRFLETPADSSLAQDIRSRWPLIPGLTGFYLSVAAGHINHEVEHLIQLVFGTLCLQEPPNGQCKAADRRNYEIILKGLDRILLGSLGSRNLNDWILSFIGYILGFMKRHEAPRIPAIYTRDHVFPYSAPESTGADGVCFEKVLLFGRSNSHSAVFGNELEAAPQFRKYVVTHRLSVDNAMASEAVPNPHLSLPLSPRKNLLKITFAKRNTFGDRQILNFQEILDFLRIQSAVDQIWLDNHVLVFDVLPAREQHRIMSLTDIYISVNGAAMINCLYLSPGSAAVNIFNGPFLEFYFSVPLREMGVTLIHVLFDTSPIINNRTHNWLSHCPREAQQLPSACFGEDLRTGTTLHCMPLRQCSVEVNMEEFQLAFLRARNAVLVEKWLGQGKFVE